MFPDGAPIVNDNNDISVDSLFSGLTPYNDVPIVDINTNHLTLLAIKENKRAKLENLYKTKLAKCWNEIIDAANNNKDEITFYPCDTESHNSNYKLSECLEYIQSELRKEYIDTQIYNTSIYISWEHLEENINDLKQVKHKLDEESDSESSYES
jgi:hypothetical protein